MAIFTSSNSTHQSTQPDTSTTIITTGTEFRGEIALACNLFMDGVVEGKLHSQKEINIGKNGFVKGEILTQKVYVLGRVEGSIVAHHVTIKSGGHVKGSITASELVVEAGGIFEGESIYAEASLLSQGI